MSLRCSGPLTRNHCHPHCSGENENKHSEMRVDKPMPWFKAMEGNVVRLSTAEIFLNETGLIPLRNKSQNALWGR